MLGPSTVSRSRRLGRVAGVVGIVVAVAAGATAAAAVLAAPGRAPAAPVPAAAPVDPARAAPVSGADSIAGAVAGLQAGLRTAPDKWQDWADLGSAYVALARVSGDPGSYPKAEGALARSLRIHPDGNAAAHLGLAALKAARHDFAGALGEADAAIAINSFSASAYALRGDALTELGRYDEALAAVQKAVDSKPGVATFSRASYQYELRGQAELARAAMQRAADDTGSVADLAFTHYYLGELAWNSGDLDEAGRQYAQGRQADPSSMPLLQGTAKVEAARGQAEAAVRDYAEVVQRLPLPQYVIEYSDLLRSLGRTAEAAQQAAVLQAEEDIFRANGVNVDLEVALYLADNGQPAEALRAAQAEYARRQATNVADALGWALHVNGRDSEALNHAREALRLGQRNALFRFHLGMIEKSLGMREEARRDLAEALRINPHFSFLQAPTARTALAELG